MCSDKKTVIEEVGVTAKIITKDDGHYFFGYYDLQPFDSTGRYHLCHKVQFQDRIPDENDICELGVIDLKDNNKFIKYAETVAWNFQQGAMLQWYKDDEHILFNIREENSFKCCILNIKTSEKRILPLPVATVSSDGKWGISVSFSRIFDFRKGYGYAGIKDVNYYENAPKDDGVFLMNMATGEYKLLVSYAQIKERFPEKPYTDGKLLINHITFNPSGTRYNMLLRNFPIEKGWATMLLSGDLKGGIYKLSDFCFQSHYHWKNDNELLIYGGDKAKDIPWGMYLYTDLTEKVERLPDPNPDRDLHCIYSPNRRYILGDDYPFVDGYCRLHLIDTATDTDTIIGGYRSITVEGATIEFRCDRHARFDRSGRYVSFDSNHTGKRTICLLDLKELKGYEW